MTDDQKEKLEQLKDALVQAELKVAEFVIKSECRVIDFDMDLYQSLCQTLEDAEEAFHEFVEEL